MRRFIRILSYIVMATAVLLGLGMGVGGALMARGMAVPAIMAGVVYAIGGLVVGSLLYMLTSIDERLERLKGDV